MSEDIWVPDGFPLQVTRYTGPAAEPCAWLGKPSRMHYQVTHLDRYAHGPERGVLKLNIGEAWWLAQVLNYDIFPPTYELPGSPSANQRLLVQGVRDGLLRPDQMIPERTDG